MDVERAKRDFPYFCEQVLEAKARPGFKLSQAQIELLETISAPGFDAKRALLGRPRLSGWRAWRAALDGRDRSA